MTPEVQQILAYIAVFLVGGTFGFWVGIAHREREVREWQAIARKAQLLNRLADSLAQERHVNGIR